MKRSALKRKTPLKAKTRVRPVSDKRKAYRASDEGQAALAYMRAVRQLPCVICHAPPPNEAHHCIHDRYGTRKASDFDTIPLCPEEHRALHAGKETWRAKHGPDWGYIEMTRKQVRDML